MFVVGHFCSLMLDARVTPFGTGGLALPIVVARRT
jgi:hypothetical protein